MTSDSIFRSALDAFRSDDLAGARRQTRDTLRLAPDHAAAEHLLGLIDCREGALTAGIEHLARAVELDPANPGFRLMLARALVDCGEGEKALAVAKAPTGPAAQRPDPWRVRAEAADAAGAYEIAAEAWARVAALSPAEWQAWSNAGNALGRLERWSEAADMLAHAVRLNPAERLLRRNFVSALGQSARFAEAAREAEVLLEADPDDGAVRMLLAKALSELGRHQESLDQYDRAVSRAIARDRNAPGAALLEVARYQSARADPIPFDIEMVRSIAVLLERTNRLDALDSLVTAAAAAGIAIGRLADPMAGAALRRGDAAGAKQLLASAEAGDLVYRFRLLSKIEDALGDPAAAFAAAAMMNRSVEDFAGWRRKAAEFRARYRRLGAAVLEGQALEPLPPSGRRTPAFLVGFPRSGTTLLDTFLMGHPATTVLEEIHLLHAAEARLGGAHRLADVTPAILAEARAAYFAELDQHVDPAFAGLVIDKMPLNMLSAPLIRALFPDAKVIFAQRHPCDCVLSCFMQSFVLNDAMASFLDIGDAADLYDVALTLFTRARAELDLSVADIVYERLIDDPQRELAPLIGFLELDWDPALLDYQRTARSRGAIITPSYHQVIGPLNKAPSGRWARYREQLKPVLPVLGPWAECLGYGAV